MADRFVSPAPPPSAYENELLTILNEECAEVIQRSTKMQRFGVNETQPGQPLTNSTRLAYEVGDVLAMIDRVIAAGLICWEDIQVGRERKPKQLAKYMQHEAPR